MSILQVCAYNVDVAKVFGPVSAIYISMLDRCCSCCDGGVIALDRTQIYNMTGVDIEKQKEAEAYLESLGVLNIKKLRQNKDKNYFSINYDKLNKIRQDPSKIQEILSSKKPITESAKKKNKASSAKSSLKSMIKDEEAPLKDALRTWIDVIFEKNGYLSAESVRLNLEDLHKTSFSVDDMVDVVNIAIKSAWKDLSWAIDRKRKDLASKGGNNFARYSEIKSEGKDSVSETF